MRRLIAVGAGALLALTACAASPPPENTITADVAFEPIENPDPADITDVVAASRTLGIDILQAADEGENLVISPISLTLALGVLAEGASGEAATELATHLGADGDARSRAMASLITAFEAYDADLDSFDPEDKPPETPLLHLANQTVLHKDFDVTDSYLERIKRFHDSGISTADLTDKASKKELDAWVKYHSGGLIEESIIEPNEDLRIVIQNAVLFAGRWQAPFAPAGDGLFHLADGSEIEVKTLSGKRYFPHTESDSWRAARLDYTEDFAAVVILPPEGTDPIDLAPETLSSLLVGVTENEPTEGQFAMPKLNLSTKLDLIEPLKKVGFSALTDVNTDPLSGISTTEPIYLAQAGQQARLMVDEDGTVAVAVTELGGEAVSAPPPDNDFIVDRPYVFVIQHVETGTTMFHAVIRDPSATD